MVYDGDIIDLLKVLVCSAFLIYACYLDIKTRRVSNRVWLVMIVAGTPFVAYELIIGGSQQLIMLIISVILVYTAMASIFYLSRYIGGAFGGADAKVIIVLSYIIPIYPVMNFSNLSFPLFGIPFGIDPFEIISYAGLSFFTAAMFALISLFSSFAFTSYFNGLIIFMIIPLLIFIFNLLKLNVKEMRESPLLMFIAYETKISDLRGKHVRLMHNFYEENGNVNRELKMFGVDIDDGTLDMLERWQKKGMIGEKVWVQALLPFMIAITLGFFTAVIFGNLMLAVM